MSSRYHYQHGPYNSNTYTQVPPMPLHLLLFIVSISIGLSKYMNYELALESLVDQLRLTIMVLPLLLLLAVHWLSSHNKHWVPFFNQLPNRESFHRAGGSLWGVGLLLVFLVFMISHQSYFHDHWFAILSH